MSAAYSPEPDCVDEAFTPEGEPRSHYAGLLEALGGEDLAELRKRID